MESVTVALGSNLGDKTSTLYEAGKFLKSISEKPIVKSSIWKSEPIGPSKYEFLNATVKIFTTYSAEPLLRALKEYEQEAGREKNPERWAPRILDLDIIQFGNLAIQKESLIIPHQEYSRRLFVLLPMQETSPDWKDPVTGKSIQQMIEDAPPMQIEKTEINW